MFSSIMFHIITSDHEFIIYKYYNQAVVYLYFHTVVFTSKIPLDFEFLLDNVWLNLSLSYNL